MSNIAITERKIEEYHNKLIENYIKDKLKEISNDIGIAIKQISVGGRTEKRHKTPDYFDCCTRVNIKFETKSYYSENTYYGGPGRGCNNNPDGTKDHEWKYDCSGNRTCKHCGKYKAWSGYSLSDISK